MDGDSAPLEEIQQVTQQHDGWLMVDDAHGTGVIGEQGVAAAGCKVKPELLVVTFGKGFGVSGAAVLCSNTVADYLLQFARHLIYSTSMPPAQAQALRASLAVIRSDGGCLARKTGGTHYAFSCRSAGFAVYACWLMQRHPAIDRR